MTITIEAIYENGVLKPCEPLPLANKDRVQVTVQTSTIVELAPDAVEESYGLVKWTGDKVTLDRLIMDAEFDPEEA
jgi:predicted DNA-binding antitoxin AbrB/MazE fold protein